MAEKEVASNLRNYGQQDFWAWLWQGTSKVLGWLVLISLIIGLILGSVFTYNAYRQGVLGTYASRLGIAILQTRIGEILSFKGVSLVDFIINPANYTLSRFDWSTKEEPGEKFGVEVKSVKTSSPFYESNEPISIVAEITAKAPPFSAIELITNCELNKSQQGVIGSLPTEDRRLVIAPNEELTFRSECLFQNGLTTDRERELISGTFNIDYDFLTESRFAAYSMKEIALERLREESPRFREKPDPFNFYSIKDPNLEGDRTMRSTFTRGSPILLAIASDSQPFKENAWYRLGVKLENRESGGGYVYRIYGVNLFTPSVVELDTAQERGRCDFEEELRSESAGSFNVYRAKRELLEYRNVDCDAKDVLALFGLGSFDDCIKKIKSKMEFACHFKFLEAGDIPVKYEITAVSDFRYSIRKIFAVELTRRLGAVETTTTLRSV